LKFLQDELSSIGRMNVTLYWTNEVTGRRGVTYAASEITEFRADATSCNISYNLTNPNAAAGDDLSFDLKDVETVRELTAEQYMKELHTASGHPEMDNISDPPQFVVVAKVANTSRAREFWLLDEDLANRVAAALNRAVRLCGGDNEQSSAFANAGQSVQDALASRNGSAQNTSVYNTTTQPTPGAQRAQNVRGVPQCTRTQYESQGATLWIVNSCSIAVTVELTSDSGNTWGQVDVGPNNRTAATIFGIGYSPRKDGTVYLFTCPKGSQPVLPNGSPFLSRNYKGQFMCSQQ
jgi:hypothetical protein